MSQPIVRRTIYDAAVEAELAQWPGVQYRREVRGKHNALVLQVGSLSRFVVYPSSPSDSRRGQQNHLGDVRRTLAALGARRVMEPKAQAPRRARNTAAPSRVDLGERPDRDPTRDPFVGLVALRRQLVDATPLVLPIRTGADRPLIASLAALVRRLAA